MCSDWNKAMRINDQQIEFKTNATEKVFEQFQ